MIAKNRLDRNDGAPACNHAGLNGGLTHAAHVEFQSSNDVELDARVMVYNVLARWRHRLPVRSVVLLLRPQALAKGVTGRFSESLAKDAEIDFAYKLVKIWELPVDLLLTGGLGTLPLAPIAAVGEQELPAIVDQMRVRLAREVEPEEAKELWTATQILMGLKYQSQFIEALMTRLIDMEESTTYQAILQKGMTRGIAVGERQLLVRQGTQKFGPPDDLTLATLEAIADPKELERIGLLMLRAGSWAEVLGS